MYILTKVVLAIMLGFVTSAILGLILVPLLKKLKIGQRISEYVDIRHHKKQGTPTMGGLIFIISTILVILLLLITNKIDFTYDLKIVFFGDKTFAGGNDYSLAQEVLALGNAAVVQVAGPDVVKDFLKSK